MRLIFPLLLAFLSTSAHAELIFNGQPTGLSELYNFNANTPSLGFEVAGGLAGTACASGTGTCSNCYLTTNPTTSWVTDQQICNNNRITPTTELVLNFTSTDKFGTPRLTTTVLTEQPVSTNAPIATTTPNQATTLRISWGNICAAFENGNATCAALVDNQPFRVGIDGNNDTFLNDTSADDYITFTVHVVDPQAGFATPYTTNACSSGGFCNYTLSKGDEKAYVSDIRVSSSGLGTTFKYVMFLCAEGSDFTAIDRPCTDKVAITGGGLANDVIEGLPNGTQYVFRAATVDIAGNIGLFLNLDQLSTPTVPGQSVTPDSVVGLFEENSCFIATAAYGSPLEKHVKVLRSFRDRILLQSSFGKLFVAAYYAVSPPLAEWIGQSPTRRSVARVLLTPIVVFTTFLMEHPFLFCLFVLSTILGFVLWIRQRREQLK